MPSNAYIKAAKQANRQPVTLMSVESINAIIGEYSTADQWAGSVALTGVSTTEISGEVVPQALTLTPTYAGTVSGKLNNQLTFTVANASAVFGLICEIWWGGFGPEQTIEARPIFYKDSVDAPTETVTVNRYTTVYGSPAEPDSYQAMANLGFEAAALLSPGTWFVVMEVKNRILGAWFVNTFVSPRVEYAAGSATLTTSTIDLGIVPTAPARIEVDDVRPPTTDIIYTVYADNVDPPTTNRGAVVDGAIIGATGYRFYRVNAAFSTTSGYRSKLREIRIIGGNSQFKHISTHAGEPIATAIAGLTDKAVSSLSSKIDLVKFSSTGEVSVKLHWTREIGDLLATGYLKNKTVKIRDGFVGLPEPDFETVFAGTWHDYTADHAKKIITVKLQNVLKRISKRKLPVAGANPVTGVKTTTPLTWNNVNGMQIILDLLDLLGVPDRELDRAEFESIRDGVRLGWDLTRTIREPVEASKLLAELSVTMGVFLSPQPTGLLKPIVYDASQPAVATLDARDMTFRAISGGQKELFTRQKIYYNASTDKPSSAEDYSNLLFLQNKPAEDNRNEIAEREWLDKWGINATIAASIAFRFNRWFADPHYSVSVKQVPPHLLGIMPGQIVTVDNLELPTAAANYGDLSAGAKFLVMARNHDPQTGGLKLDLYDVQTAGAPGAGVVGTDLDVAGPAVVTGASNLFVASAGLPPYSWSTTEGVISTVDATSANLDATGVTANAGTVSCTDAGGTVIRRFRVGPDVITGFVFVQGEASAWLDWDPISTNHEIREGNDWASGTVIAKGAGNWFDLGTPAPATYKYWIAAVSDAGDYSAPVSVTGVVVAFRVIPTDTNQLTDGANLGGTSAWSGVSGTGKPADNATIGAIWGSDLVGTPSNLAAVTGTEVINNQLITINANGTLAGAGGGQITTTGIGAETPAGAQGKVDAVVVGGRNLITSSSLGGTIIDPVLEERMLTRSVGVNWRVAGFTQHDNNEYYSVSFKIKTSIDVTVAVDVVDSNLINVSSTAAYQTVKMENILLNSSLMNNPLYYGFVDFNPSLDCDIYIKELKLEKGSKATAWTPAPEDVSQDAQSKADAAEAAAKNYTDTNFVLTTTQVNDIALLQSQIDKNITSWFYDGVPLLTNLPASDWADNATKNVHLSDLYYDNISGYAYRFQLVSNVYSWVKLSDSDVTLALSKAQNAQDTADGKRRVFVAIPVHPYDIGDLWDTGTTVKRSTVNQTTAYNIADWVEIANYTTNTSELVDGAGLGTTSTWGGVLDRPADPLLLNELNGIGGYQKVSLPWSSQPNMIDVYVDNATATEYWFKVAEFTLVNPYESCAWDGIFSHGNSAARFKAQMRTHINVNTTISGGVVTSKAYKYSGDNLATRLKVFINANVATFYVKLGPYQSCQFNGAWSVLSNDLTRTLIHSLQSATDNVGTTVPLGTEIVPVPNYQLGADVTADSSFVNTIYPADQTALQTQVDGKVESWFQSTDPSGAWATPNINHKGDMWWNTTTSKLKRYDGTAWSSDLTDQKAIDAFDNASTAQATADGKAVVFMTTPANYDVGDLWDAGGTPRILKRATVARAVFNAADWTTVANEVTNTTQVTDGAGLGTTANWPSVSNIPPTLEGFGDLLNPAKHWVGGTSGSQGIFSQNGSTAENRVAFGIGPLEQNEELWECLPDANADADGGWNTSLLSIDPLKTYVHGCYFWTLDNTGTTYFGCSKSHTENLGGTVNTNPYFWYGGLPSNLKWYLVLGVVHPEGYSGTSTGLAGVYDVETGAKVIAATEFRQKAATTNQVSRAYHYYNTTGDGATVKQRMARPFIIESTRMPSIDSLTLKLSSVAAGADVTDYAAAAATAQAKADAAQANAIATADTAAQAKADLAQTNAQAHADGIVTAEEARAIADAQAKADAAEANAKAAAALDATAKADLAQVTAVKDANVVEENSTLTVSRPVGGSFSANSTQVGALKITLPQSWSATMLKFTIDVYQYSATKSFSLSVGGYNYSAGYWLNTSVNMIGSTAADNRVRFGHDGTKCCIYIGDPTSSWAYVKVTVRDFQAGFGGFSRSQWESGWVIGLTTTIGTISAGADYADALIDAATIKGQGDLATNNRSNLLYTDGADVTSNNTAAGITGQGALATLPSTGTNDVILGASSTLRSSDYNGTTSTPGTTGWAIGYTGDAVFNNATIRGSLDTGVVGANNEQIQISSSTGQIKFNGDRGDGVVEELASIGLVPEGAYSRLMTLGSANYTSGKVLRMYSASTETMLYMVNSNSLGHGINVTSGNSAGVFSSSGTAIIAAGDVAGITTSSNPIGGVPLLIYPKGASIPTFVASLGSIVVDLSGIIYINTDGSTGWIKIGSQ